MRRLEGLSAVEKKKKAEIEGCKSGKVLQGNILTDLDG